MHELTVQEARDLVNKYHKDYYDILKKIESAAEKGKEFIIVPVISSSEIRGKITGLGYDISHIDSFEDRIYWGT